jgi:DNA-binding MarR family transcriptional regulator
MMNKSNDEIVQQVIDRFWEIIPPVWNTVRSQVQCVAAEQFGITVEQFHVLRHIRKGAHSVSELADIRHISRPAISQGVDGLVNKGLISRQQSASDRRYVRLELTDSGAVLLDAIFSQARQWMKTKLTSLEESDLENITSALTMLKQAFEVKNG